MASRKHLQKLKSDFDKINFKFYISNVIIDYQIEKHFAETFEKLADEYPENIAHRRTDILEDLAKLINKKS